jgi:hypothetical protein
LSAALRGDEVVEGVDLGIKQFEDPLPVNLVPAEGCGLPFGH